MIRTFFVCPERELTMNGFISGARASTLWIVLLTLAATATTFLFACATPFAALAALAALHMRRRDGVILMSLTWLASQAVGFGLHHYPQDPKTLAWGLGIGTAAIGSVFSAYGALARIGGAFVPARLAAALVAAFAAFTAGLLVWALFLGGVSTTLSPSILAAEFARNGAVLLGLLALYHALIRIGLPAAPSARRAIPC